MKFKRIVFDIESDSLLEGLTKIHSLCLKCADTGETLSCADMPTFTPISEGLELLKNADLVIGHNIMKFDLPALEKVYGLKIAHEKVYDTLIVTRLIYADLIDQDFIKRPKGLGTKQYGSHSLDAWGKRLGELKGNFGAQTDWKNWSISMQKYCEQDVEVNDVLFKRLEKEEYSPTAIKLEHDFQSLIIKQENHGVPFREEDAKIMADEVKTFLTTQKKVIQDMTGLVVTSTTFVPKRNNSTLGYIKDVPIIKRTTKEFNPASRKQIIDYLKGKYKWNPVDFTKKGNPKVSASVLRPLDMWPEVPLLIDYLDAHKLAGQLYNGDNAWLRSVKNGRIYGQLNTNGAITGRCTHFKPNLAQVPTPRSYKGTECRKLFYAPKGFKFVGADASGLELRMLAHYLAAYDSGSYIKTVLEGDVHTSNQEAAGLPSRDTAKTFAYAFLYGSGDAKLGAITLPTASALEQKDNGARLKSNFFAKLPAIKRLLTDVKAAAKRKGFLRGLDGRRLIVRSDHRALNTLLQGAGAVVCKQWNVTTWQLIKERGLDPYCYQVLSIHDEFQVVAWEEYAEQVAQCAEDAMPIAQELLKVKCRLDAEAKIGLNWGDTH